MAAEAPDVQFVPDGERQNTHGGTGGGDDCGFYKSVRLFLVDPDRGAEVMDVATAEYKCDGGPNHCVTIRKSASLLEAVDKVREQIPAGRTVRAIYGALEIPATWSVIPDATRLQSNEKVEAFVQVTASNPIRLQVVLHRDPNQIHPIPNSPPRNDRPSVAVDVLDAVEVYQDPAEDSDVLQRNLAGMAKRTLHKIDIRFENRKWKIRKRIRRQQRVLRTMMNKQRLKFPNANVYNSHDAEFSWMDDLDPKPQNGQEVVFQRGLTEVAIAAYDADLANHASPYTAAQKTAAVAAGTAVEIAQ